MFKSNTNTLTILLISMLLTHAFTAHSRLRYAKPVYSNTVNLIEDDHHHNLGMVNNNNMKASRKSKKELCAPCGCETSKCTKATYKETWSTVGTCHASW